MSADHGRIGNRALENGQAGKKIDLAIIEKHERACVDNQYCFIPFSFDTFGFWDSQSNKLFRRLQKIMDIK